MTDIFTFIVLALLLGFALTCSVADFEFREKNFWIATLIVSFIILVAEGVFSLIFYLAYTLDKLSVLPIIVLIILFFYVYSKLLC